MPVRFLSTAIPYVNAAPHLGFALELVQADVLARHARQRGDTVRFVTGTDDNAGKNVAAAAAAGVAVAEFVDRNARRFADLRGPLELSYDDFIRTGRDPRHAAGVRELWRRCAARGDFYRRRYTGRYCGGCEQFYADAELVAGRCPEHGTPPQLVTETNWFFRLSRYGRRLQELIETDTVLVTPAARRNEVLAFLRSGLQDISVSRPAERSAGWGIAVPGDPDQVVWVWWDALANYVTVLGFGTDPAGFASWWTDAADRTHLIGKGVIRFHAVFWLAQLLSAGLTLPSRIVVHDYLTLAGAKISKSAGATVDPAQLSDRYGPDAVRWWLLRDVAPVGDTDFTEERLVQRANQDLANGLGNLVHRTVSLVDRYRGGRIADGIRPEFTAGLADRIDVALARPDFRAATGALTAAVDAGNRLVESTRPWELHRAERAGDAAAGQRLDAVLTQLVVGGRELATQLWPFTPRLADRLRAALGSGCRIGPVEPAYRRLELAADRNASPLRSTTGR